MKKKLLVLCLALCLVASAFVGCTPTETEQTPTGPVATPPAAVTDLAVDALGNITWTAGTDAAAWKVQYKLGAADYKDYATVEDAAVTVTEILKAATVEELQAANAKNMSVQVAAVNSKNEASAYTEIANVLGTGKKLRTVTTLAELKEVGDVNDYIVIAKDIVISKEDAYAAIVNIAANDTELGTRSDEDVYCLVTRAMFGVMNGLGNTISYTFVDDQQRSKEFGGLYSWLGQDAIMMNLDIKADITKDFDKSQVNIDRWTCPVSWFNAGCYTYNCNITASYKMPNQTADRARFGNGMFVTNDATYENCTFNYAAYKVKDAAAEEKEYKRIDFSGHSTGVMGWSGDMTGVVFTNCVYFIDGAGVPANFNPWKGTYTNCVVTTSPMSTPAAE